MVIIAIVVILIAAIYCYGKRNFDYWAKRGVKHDNPIPYFGTYLQRFLFKRSVADTVADVYRKYPDERFVGAYRGSTPELIIRDPDLIKHIIINDFNHFHRRGLIPKHGVVEPLLKNLFFVDGDLWRLLRQRMTPAFSSGKLRAMFPLVCEKATRLQTRLNTIEQDKTLDARDIMARYTTDFIGSVGFGLDPDSINDDNSEFRKLGAKIFEITPVRAISLLLKNLFPNIFKHLKLMGQELEDEVQGIVNGIQKQRNFKPCGRNDFIDLLLELKEKGKIVVESLEHVNLDGTPKLVELEMDNELMAAQAFIFFAAGFETSSSATSFTLHQLAYNAEVQKKVQADIDRVLAKYDNKLCFDAIKEMTYLEWSVLEAMRMFPSSGYLSRQCTKKYTIPGSTVTIDEGVNIMIPLQAIHNDPKYFDNPEEFRPERFAFNVTPTELLVALHLIDPAKADLKYIIKATALCFAEKSIFTQDVVSAALQRLGSEEEIPVLLMRSVLQALTLYPSCAALATQILELLLEREVWTHKVAWEGWIKCCERLAPASCFLLVSLPARALQAALGASPAMTASLRSHIGAMSTPEKALLPTHVAALAQPLQEPTYTPPPVPNPVEPLPPGME